MELALASCRYSLPVTHFAARRSDKVVEIFVSRTSLHRTVDFDKHFVYKLRVIRSFSDSETERFFVTGQSRRLPRDILRRAAMRLRQLDAATRIEDLRLPPSNRLEELKGNRAGQHSIRINDQWRVCFRFGNGDAFEVEIIDYH